MLLATDGEFIQFPGFASGSRSELLTRAVIAEIPGFGLSELRGTVIQRTTAIQKMIFTFIKTLR
jgi:hypothetical protein